MSVGLALIKRLLIEKRDFASLRDARIDLNCLEKDEKVVFKFVEAHYLKHGVLPKLETVTQETEIKFPKVPDEPIGYWINAVIQRYQSNLVIDAYKGLKNTVTEDDIAKAQSIATKLALDLERLSPTNRVGQLADFSKQVLIEHDKRQKKGGLTGVPFGMPYLDMVSDGAQPGDTIALVGRPSVGKSYFCYDMALKAYTYEESKEVPLVVILEMNAIQTARRLLALRTGVSATLIRTGQLSHWGRRTVAKGVRGLESISKRPFYILQGGMDTTVEDLLVRVQELRPTILYVDGAYLLRTRSKYQSKWERVAETAEFLKIIASEFDIPVIATYQFNRKGSGSLGNIAFSDVIGQLASIVIGIDDEQPQGHVVWTVSQHKTITLLKGREGEKGKVRVLYDMERMKIEQVEVISGMDDEPDDNDDL